MSSFAPPAPPRDVTQNISTHHEFRAADNSAVTAVLPSHTWPRAFAYLLYTSICYTGSIKCISMQKHPRWCLNTHTYTHSWASLSLWRVMWGSDGRIERRRPRYTPRPLFTCLEMYIGARTAGDWCIVLQISWLSTSRWPLGEIRGLSGRCKLYSCSSSLLSKKQGKI